MKKSLIKPLIFGTALLMFSVPTVYSQEDAGQPGEFLRYGVNARALGMGRAFTAVTNNANAIYWNPGGLYNIIRDGLSLTLMYSTLYESTTYNFAAVAVPVELFFSADVNRGLVGELKKWNLGFGYLGLSSDGFEVRNRFNQVTGETFSEAQTAVYLTVARSVTIKDHRFGIGLNYKLLTHKLYDQKANTAALDLGLKYQPPLSWLEVGANVQNVNSPDFQFAQGGSDQIPLSVRLGTAFRPKTGKKWLDAFLLSFDFMAIPPGKRNHDWFAGAEYNLLPVLYNLPIKLRLGINSREDFTLGFNLDLPNNIFYTRANQVLPELDWAYLPDQDNALGGLSKRFSLDFSYTPFTSERWYKRGLEKFKNENYKLAVEDFLRAKITKNLKKQGFPLAATLRVGDIHLLLSQDKKKGLLSALKYYQEASEIPNIQTEIDVERNQRSYLLYLQALFFKKEYKSVIQNSSSEIIWGVHHTAKDSDAEIIALRSWAYYYLGQYPDALESLTGAKDYFLCKFLLGLIKLEQKKYAEAREIFSEILSTENGLLPDYFYVYPFPDHLLLDDAQFLHAYAGYKVSQAEINHLHSDQLLELAEIKRFYPDSDLDRYLTQKSRFEELIRMNEENDYNVFDDYFSQYLSSLKEGGMITMTPVAN